MTYLSDFQVTPITPNFDFLQEIMRGMGLVTDVDIAAAEPKEGLREDEPVIGVYTKEEMVMAALHYKLDKSGEAEVIRRVLKHLIQASIDKRLEVGGKKYVGYLTRAGWKIVGWSREDADVDVDV